jgi:hypothetical protein
MINNLAESAMPSFFSSKNQVDNQLEHFHRAQYVTPDIGGVAKKNTAILGRLVLLSK